MEIIIQRFKIRVSIAHQFEVHLKLYCTHLTVQSLYCPVRVRYPGNSCPNVSALTVQISVIVLILFLSIDKKYILLIQKCLKQ